MESLPVRKKLPPLAIERLEDRCVLSPLGQLPGSGGSPPSIEALARMVPIAQASSGATSGALRSSIGAADASGLASMMGNPGSADPSPSPAWAGNTAAPTAAASSAQGAGPSALAGLASWSAAHLSSAIDLAASMPMSAVPSAAWQANFADPAAAGQGPAGEVSPFLNSSFWGARSPSGTPADTSTGRPGVSPAEASRADFQAAIATLSTFATGAGASAAPAFRPFFPAPALGPADAASTARAEVIAPAGPGIFASPADSPSIVLASVPAAGAGKVTSEGQARGSATPLVVGWASTEDPARPAFEAGVRGGTDPRTPATPPPTHGWQLSEVEVSAGDDGLAPSPSDQGTGPLDPQLADVITSLVPSGRALIGDAIDRFLEPFDGLVPSLMMARLSGPLGLVTASLAMAGSVLAVEVALRVRCSRGEEDEAEGGLGPARFPGLPGSWGWSRS